MPSEGEKLKELIKLAPKKQRDIATEIGTTSEQISRAFKQERIPPGLKLKVIQYFDLPLDHFEQEATGINSSNPDDLKKIKELLTQIEYYKNKYEEESEKGKRMLAIIEELTKSIKAISEGKA